MKKIELSQKNRILFIVLLALFIQILFITPVFAEEDEKGQDTVQIETAQEESKKEDSIVDIPSIDNTNDEKIFSKIISNKQDEISIDKISLEDSLHQNDESSLEEVTLPKSEVLDATSKVLLTDSKDLDNNANNDADNNDIHNDEKGQETVQIEKTQEESQKEDIVVDIPSIDNANDGEKSSENLSNTQDEISKDKILVEDNLPLNNETSLEEVVLPKNEVLDETSKALLTDSNDLDNNVNKNAVNNDIHNDEKGQETVQVEKPQEESKKEDIVVDIPSIDDTNYGEKSSEKLSNKQDEISKDKIPVEDNLPLNNESSLEEVVLPKSEVTAQNLKSRAVEPPTDLTSYVTNAIIDADQDENGAYIIHPDYNYNVTIFFAEQPGHQFNNHETLTYTIPKGFNDLITQNGEFTVTVTTDDGKTVDVTGNKYSIEDGVLKIKWSSTNPNVDELFSANNANFSITFSGSFDGTKTDIQYNDSVITPIKYDDTESSIEMTKSSTPVVNSNSPNDNPRIDYTIVINSTGINDNVNLKDILSGNGVQLDEDSFKVESNKPINHTITANEDNSFDFHANRLSDGQVVTITYSALLDSKFAEIIGEGENKRFYINANNHASITSTGENNPPPVVTDNKIEFKPYIYKIGKLIDNNRIVWNVSINVNNELLIKNMPVVDTIDPDSAGYMSYDTSLEFTVKIYDEEGNLVRTVPVSWNQILNAAGTGWTYVIPSDDNYYRYEIEYTTKYEEVLKDTTLKNDVEIGDNESSAGVDVEGYGDIQLEKAPTYVDSQALEVEWEVIIDVPAVGLDSTNNVLVDTYPYRYLGNKTVYEPIIPGDYIQVTGLVGQESYKIDYFDTYATISFYKDGNQTPGLTETTSNRQIKIVYKTEINREWLNKTEESDGAQYILHTNTIEMGGKKRYGVAYVSNSTLQKKVSEPNTVTIDGEEYPCYTYEILFGRIGKDNFTLDDIFDTSLFRIYAPEGDTNVLVVSGGDSIYNQTNIAGSWSNVRQISYTETSTGVTFIITPNELATKTDGSLYNFYSFKYYLIPKNLEALRDLMKNASDNNGQYNFVNKIKYEDKLEAQTTGTYYYSALTKRQVGEFDPSTGSVNYEIVVNPDQLVLNNGNTITLTDTYENMSIVYDSIVVTPSTDIAYDTSSNTITFELPDAKTVTITYTAKIIFKTNEVEYYNIAALLAGNSTITKDVSGVARQDSSGQGSASQFSMHILKYEAGNMSNRLKGAVFELLDANKNNIVNNKGEKVVFETNDDGIIRIFGKEEADGWSLAPGIKYYVHEIQAPIGYQLKDTYYEFTIATNGVPDYEHYIYFNADTLNIRNIPGTDIFVEKQWENGEENHQSDIVTVKLQEKIGDGEWKDSDVNPITLSAENDWRDGFKKLPLVLTVGEDDIRISYRVVEFLVNGKPVAESDYSITLQEGNPTTYIIVNK